MIPARSPINTAQIRRGPLAVLRRAQNIKSASEEERNALLEDAERIESGCAWLVLAAIFFEVVVWISPLCPFFFKTGNAISDAAVAVGILGEMRFGQVVGNIFKILLADANERASRANLEAAWLRSQIEPRAITKEQHEILQSLKGIVSSVNITSCGDFEANGFARQIAQTLVKAGIEAKLCDPRIGMTWADLYVVIPEPIPDLQAEPISATFREAGFSIGCGFRTQIPMGDLPANIPVIMVGEKRWPTGVVPPYPYTAAR